VSDRSDNRPSREDGAALWHGHPARGLSREEQARREIGVTAISRPCAWALVVLFLLALVAVPVWQHIRELTETPGAWPQPWSIFPQVARAARFIADPGHPVPPPPVTLFGTDNRVARTFTANALLLRDIQQYEDTLKNDSVLRQNLQPTAQHALLQLGVGNEEVYVGRDTWLFYRPGVDYVTGPGFLDPDRLAARRAGGSEWEPAPRPDPVRAILQFRDQLAVRGIRLIIVPAPTKATIHPEHLSSRYAGATRPVQNASFASFVDRLERQGVVVFDPAEVIFAAKRGERRPAYLRTDSHWRPWAVDLAARTLAACIRERDLLPQGPGASLQRSSFELLGLGDLARMLRLPVRRPHLPRSINPDRPFVPSVPLDVVVYDEISRGDHPWRPSRDADVLLLGDSFANIYSLGTMGWGESAGLAEQLSFHLGRPLDVIIRNDAGAHATRGLLDAELRKGRDRLAGKKLVIWEFAARELAAGDWKLFEMKRGEPRPSRFFVPNPGESVVVDATVAEVAPSPRPYRVSYKDHIVAVRLVDLEGPGVHGAEAAVYMHSMIDRTWQPPARYRIGQRLRVRLTPWESVRERYKSINTAELESLVLEEFCWGDPAE
jgi:alginate O-acetyltransferase complex protein AlgJ